MTKRLLYDTDWLEAAARLQAQGYVRQDHEGIIPAIFVKPGHEPLYLVLPTRPGATMAEREWTPRPLSEKPMVFGVRDAAEHLGCAVSTIKHALSGKTDNPLVPDQRVGRKLLVFTEETLMRWDASRRKPGAAPTEKHMTFDRLYLVSQKDLIEIVQRHFVEGTLPLQPFVDAVALEDHLNRWELLEMAQQNIRAFAERLSQLKRIEMIHLMSTYYTGDPVAAVREGDLDVDEKDQPDVEMEDEEETELEL